MNNNNNNNFIQQNQLLNQWQNMNNQNINYNNTLLQNNRFVQQSMQNRMQQMKYIQQMQQLRKMQLMQQMQNKIKEYTKNLLEPIAIKEDNSKVKENFEKLDKIRNKEMKQNKIIDNKTKNELNINNTPYKQIITHKEYGGEAYKKKHSKNTFNKDILVHKVNNTDKNIKLFEKQLAEKQQKLKIHNNKLQKIYADEKKEEHLKKFEYRKTNVYRHFKEDVNVNHNDMKKDRLKVYEKHQKEWEKDNIKVSHLVQNLKDKGILTNDQLNSTMGQLENEINNKQK